MKVAIDSSALFAIFKGEADREAWLNLIIRLAKEGAQLVACEIVWAEVAGLPVEEWKLRQDMADFQIQFDVLDISTCFAAGKMFKAFKQNRVRSERAIAIDAGAEGQAPPPYSPGPQKRILPDFLIAAHALRQTDGLITNDQGFKREYFQSLHIIEP